MRPAISPRTYRRTTGFALAVLVLIIVTGGAVRLTGSGLGCSDWPTCEQGQLLAPLELHPMIEFVNRLITGVVSIAVMAAVLGSLLRQPRRRDLIWWSLGLVAGVVGQIVLGGATVLAGLAPPYVIGHYLLSIALVWNALILFNRASGPGTPTEPVVSKVAIRLSRAVVVTGLAVLVTGTVVTGTGPHGGDEQAPRFGFTIVDVAHIHSVAAWTLLLLCLVVIGRTAREGLRRSSADRGRLLVASVLAQGAIGYLQYFTGIPPGLVALHLTGSVAVFLAAVWHHLGLFEPIATDGSVSPFPSIDRIGHQPL